MGKKSESLLESARQQIVKERDEQWLEAIYGTVPSFAGVTCTWTHETMPRDMMRSLFEYIRHGPPGKARPAVHKASDPSEADPRFKRTSLVVEATQYEYLSLWRAHHAQVRWNIDSSRRQVTVGFVNGFPVTIAAHWSELDGSLVLFWEATSRMVDNDMVVSWLETACRREGPTGGEDIVPDWTDAMGFGERLRRIARPGDGG